MEVAIKDLTKVFGGKVEALSGVDLRIETGMFGLLGPNGAGKTTLMRILAGILRPSSGSAFVGGYDCAVEKDRTIIKRTLGYLPQELGLYPDLSAAEFLDYIGILKGIEDRRTRRSRVDELLDVVGLTDVAKRKLKGFSGGMKRRVGIAQALLNDPQFLIVDEPTAGLDPEERIRFRNLLSDLSGDRTVLLSTHIVEDVAQTSRDLAVLADGRVLFRGTAEGLISAARGKVWEIETDGAKPSSGLTVVSTLHLSGSVRYRVVGEPSEHEAAEEAQPSLEDGYVWLMRRTASSGRC